MLGDIVPSAIEKVGMNPHFASVFRRREVRVQRYGEFVWLVNSDRVIF